MNVTSDDIHVDEPARIVWVWCFGGHLGPTLCRCVPQLGVNKGPECHERW